MKCLAIFCMDWDVSLLAFAEDANQVAKDLVLPCPSRRPVAELDLYCHTRPGFR